MLLSPVFRIDGAVDELFSFSTIMDGIIGIMLASSDVPGRHICIVGEHVLFLKEPDGAFSDPEVFECR
jgi:hypothetical protein